MKLRIDPEFKALLWPLSKEEYEQLEQNILAEGCRDPLVVWQDIILDGHNRYEICQKHGLEFQTVPKLTIATRQDAIDWIDKNQLGRRNLNPDQMSLIRARIRERRKFPVGGDRGHQRSGGENRQMHQTLHETAKELGVGTKTLQEDVQFARAVEAQPEVKEKIERGERVVKKDVIAAAKAKAAGDEEGAKRIIEGKAKEPVVPDLPKGDTAAKLDYIFGQAKMFDKWDRAILDIQKDVLAQVRNPAMALFYQPFFKQAIQRLREELRKAKPAAACPDCKGSGCDTCRGTGFVATILKGVQE
jgi:hypothetical protein